MFSPMFPLKTPIINTRTITINGSLCYINHPMVLHSRGIKEYLKYKLLRRERVSLVVKLLSYHRVERELIEQIRDDSVRFTPEKLEGATISATAELLFPTGEGRDAYTKKLTEDLKIVYAGGLGKEGR